MNNKHFSNYPLNFRFMDHITMELVYRLNDQWENQIEQQLKLMPKDKK